MKQYTNKQVDEAFTKLNLLYFASENPVVQTLVYEAMEKLATEVKSRDQSIKHKVNQFMLTLKGMVGNSNERRSTDDN